jgi:putative tricarboxylic transport membrane protein
VEAFGHLIDGFAVALTAKNVMFCTIGVLWGTIVGVLPGLGPLAGMTLLLPLTFSLDPLTAIIMLAGIFYGAMYGGSTTSILMRIPGEAASVVTCLDGYEMARRGRAGPALVIAALGSFVGGTASVLGLMLLAPPLATVMLKVGPAAEFMLMVLALIVLGFVSTGPAVKTLAMILLGLLISTVGLDPLTVWPRFTFGSLSLADGISFIAIAIGLFGVSEILLNFEQLGIPRPASPRLKNLMPRRADLKAAAPSVGRGTVVGFLFGVIPGVSHVLSTFVAYALEKKLSRQPETFGQGAIAGVAGPETANNATTGSSLIPLLVLGIPSIPATALLLSALMIHGIQPGPLLLAEHPQVFWGLVASMYLGNLILLILNVPLVGLFVSLLRIPYVYLAPTVLVICAVGVYSVKGTVLDLWLMVGFGILGYALRKFGFDVAPLLIAIVLGERIELDFRRALTISDGDFSIFLSGAALEVLIIATTLIVGLHLFGRLLGYRRDAAILNEPRFDPGEARAPEA